MIHSTDLDRALTAWFDAEAMAPAPQDLINAVPAIGAGRRPRPRLLARLHQVSIRPALLDLDAFPAVTVVWLLLLLMAAALTVIGAGRLLERPLGPDHGVVPPSFASVAPSVTAASGVVPPALRYAWIGDPRALPDYGIETRTKLNFDAGALWGTGTNYPPRVADSRVTFEGDLMVLTGTEGDCATTDVGRYRWSLSAGGTILTMQLGSDPCEIRAKLVPGTWYRTDCKKRRGPVPRRARGGNVQVTVCGSAGEDR